MRFVISIVAALMIRASRPSASSRRKNVHGSFAGDRFRFAPRAGAKPRPCPRRHPVNPVNQARSNGAESAAAAPPAAAAPMQVAQATHGTAPAAANARRERLGSTQTCACRPTPFQPATNPAVWG